MKQYLSYLWWLNESSHQSRSQINNDESSHQSNSTGAEFDCAEDSDWGEHELDKIKKAPLREGPNLS